MKFMPFMLGKMVFLALIVLASSCRKQETEEEKIVRPVITIMAPVRGAERVRTFSGAAKAALETLLSFRVDGEIIELNVKQGMPIEAGNVIARLDQTDYELKVKQCEAEKAQSAANLKQTKTDYERTRQLYEAASVSKSELDSALNMWKSGMAQMDAVEKLLDMARQQVLYCTLKAPLDGAISLVPVETHQTVSSGQTIAKMTSGKEMEMELGLPAALINLLHIGDEATISFIDLGTKTYKATVSEVGISADDSSTYPVTLKLLDHDDNVRVGMVGSATFSFKTLDDVQAIIIPLQAVASTPTGERFIWIFKPGQQEGYGSVTKRIVKIGSLTSNGIQILEGLEPGEIVVIRGVHHLTESMQVRLLQE